MVASSGLLTSVELLEDDREELKLANKQYEFFVHIENDVKIYNLPLIESYFRKIGYFMSYCSRHCFLESNVMILNDKSQNQKIIDFYQVLVLKHHLNLLLE